MKLLDFIICDDIRNEIGNKNSIIGVYSDAIVFSVNKESSKQWPKRMKLGFFIRILFEETDEIPDKFVFNMLIDSELKEIGKGDLNIQKKGSSNKLILALVHNNFLFQNEGIMEFQFDFYKDNKIVNQISPDISLQVKESIIN